MPLKNDRYTYRVTWGVPQPIASKRYSGKFMVRVPPEVHRNLAIQASESRVSLNRIVGAKLSR